MIEPLLEAERALTVGMLDHAERLYRSVAEMDPRNSIAVVGLARVELERGSEVEALRLARRALGIDAENVAARRLAARLEEVLRNRGVDLPPEDDIAEAGPAEAGPAEAGAAEAGAVEASSEDAPADDGAALGAKPPRRPRRGLLSRLLDRGR